VSNWRLGPLVGTGLIALIAVVVGTASTALGAPVAAVGAILLLAAFCLWIIRCRPSRCDRLTGSILGFAAAAGVLGAVRLLSGNGSHLTPTLAVVAIVLTMLLIASIVAGCCSSGWCLPLIWRRPGPVPRAELEPPSERHSQSWESVDKPLTSRGYGAGAEMYTSAALTAIRRSAGVAEAKVQAYEPGRRRFDPVGNGDFLGKTTFLNPPAACAGASPGSV